MASNAVVFFAGVGTTFVILTAGFSSGLVFTKAAFDDTRAAYPGRPETAAVRQSYFACLWRASVKRHYLYQTSLRPRRPSQRPKPKQFERLPRLLHKFPRRTRGR